MPDDLAQALSAANIRASAAMPQRKRLEAWFAEKSPGHPRRQQTMWEAEQEEKRALDEYVHLRNIWTSRQARSEAEAPSL